MNHTQQACVETIRLYLNGKRFRGPALLLPLLQAQSAEIKRRDFDAWMPSPLPASLGPFPEAVGSPVDVAPPQPPSKPAAAAPASEDEMPAAAATSPGVPVSKVDSGKFRIAKLLQELDMMLHDPPKPAAGQAWLPSQALAPASTVQSHASRAVPPPAPAAEEFEFQTSPQPAAEAVSSSSSGPAGEDLRSNLRRSLGGGGPLPAAVEPPAAAIAKHKPYGTPVRLPAASQRVQAEWQRRTTVKAARSTQPDERQPSTPPRPLSLSLSADSPAGGSPARGRQAPASAGASYDAYEVTGNDVRRSPPLLRPEEPLAVASPLLRLDSMMARFSNIGQRLRRTSNGGDARYLRDSFALPLAPLAAAGHADGQAAADARSQALRASLSLAAAERADLQVETLAAAMSPPSAGLAQHSIKVLAAEGVRASPGSRLPSPARVAGSPAARQVPAPSLRPPCLRLHFLVPPPACLVT